MMQHEGHSILKAGYIFRGRFKLIHNLDLQIDGTAICHDMKQNNKMIYMKIEDSECWHPTIF
jgi:hypothetical protein